MENYKLYIHKFPNGKVYVGITSQDVKERWRNGEGYKNQLVYRAILKYGWDAISHQVLLSGMTKEEAEEKEIEFISAFNSNNPEYGYNVSNGGNCSGTLSEEARKKISDAKMGHKFYCNNPEERGEKISNAMKRRNAERPEIMDKMCSASVERCSKAVLQKTVDGQEVAIWASAAEIERVLGINHMQISRACRKDGKVVCGYLWSFV